MIEAFANGYRDAFDHIRSDGSGPGVPGVPGIGDGLVAMICTDLVVSSNADGDAWVEWPQQ